MLEHGIPVTVSLADLKSSLFTLRLRIADFGRTQVAREIKRQQR